MKTLYLDCSMGAAGDMLTGALLELTEDPEAVLKELNQLGIPGVEFQTEKRSRCGIAGTGMNVLVNGLEEGAMHAHHHDHDHEHDHSHEEEHAHHHHSGMAEITQIIEKEPLPEEVRKDVLAVYQLIAEAESHVHGQPVEQIHFHEVGTLDAVADISAVCLLMHKLAPEQVIVSPVHVGAGQVECAHGLLPVPAPATAWILREVPIYGGAIQGELCTPTGAALLKHFATSFGEMPVMKVQRIGYGMGRKEFQAANCVRALLGESEAEAEQITDLNFNVDDMTAEEIGFAAERIFEAGALEVYTVPAGMKKSRPGTLIHVLCRPSQQQDIAAVIFRYTSTLGIRRYACSRYTLQRQVENVETEYGTVRRKDVSGFGISRSKYEYEDLAAIARREGLSIQEVREKLEEKKKH